MNLLAPLARPLFAWNHDVVMAWGLAGLLRLLAAAPPEQKVSSFRPGE